MSNYPFALSVESTVAASDNSVVDVAGDGTPKIRRLWSANSYSLTLVTKNISDTEKNTLTTFYADNLSSAVTVTFLNDTYSAYFKGPPTFTYVAGEYWDAFSELIGTKV